MNSESQKKNIQNHLFTTVIQQNPILKKKTIITFQKIIYK